MTSSHISSINQSTHRSTVMLSSKRLLDEYIDDSVNAVVGELDLPVSRCIRCSLIRFIMVFSSPWQFFTKGCFFKGRGRGGVYQKFYQNILEFIKFELLEQDVWPQVEYLDP